MDTQAKPRIGELLIRDGVISQDQLREGLQTQKTLGGRMSLTCFRSITSS